MASFADEFWEDAAAAATPPPAPAARPHSPRGGGRAGHPFRAPLGVAEVDGRDRPTAEWVARSVELGRSHVVLLSRRMVYEGRRLRVKLHLVDDRPVLLFGRVLVCDYAGDGLHRVEVALERRASESAAGPEDSERTKKAADVRPPPPV